MITDERFNSRQDLIEAEQRTKSWLINKVSDGQKAWDPLQHVQTENAKEAALASKDTSGRVDVDGVNGLEFSDC